MTIVVGSTVPGLLGALEHALGGSRDLVLVHDAETLLKLIAESERVFDGLVLSDTITPRPNQDVVQSLWEIVATMNRRRRPPAPILLTLDDETPLVIQDALAAEVDKTGGAVALLSQRVRTPTHPDAQRVVAWVIAQLHLEPPRGQVAIAPANAAAGTGASTTLLNLCIYLRSRGLRVLMVDLETAERIVPARLRIEHEPIEGFITLPDAFPGPAASYPVDGVQQRVFRHRPSGLDLLVASNAMGEQPEPAPHHLDRLFKTVADLDYDLVCYDLPGDWFRRLPLVGLFVEEHVTPLVFCPPGRTERSSAMTGLEHLHAIERDDGSTALDAAMVLFVEGERGLIRTVRDVRRDLIRAYPMLADLGTLPRDTALLSAIDERPEYASVFDLAPRRPYCTAIRTAARRWMDAIDLPQSWLTQPDPHLRPPRRFPWLGKRPIAFPFPPRPTWNTASGKD
jgi:hypothetical protein